MDWPRERHVRLYCRDTATWQALGYPGQCMVILLLRVLDQHGRADLGDLEPWQFAVTLFHAPADHAQEGMAQALRLGVFVRHGRELSMPNFELAQSSPKSSALRMREYRGRLREEAALRNVTSYKNGHDLAHPTPDAVTKCNDPLRTVTHGYARLRKVTPSTGGNGFSSEPPYEDDPGQVGLPPVVPWMQLLKVWEKAAFNGMPSGDPHSHRTRLEAIWTACVARDAHDPLGVFRRAADAYCAVQQGKRKPCQLRWFASDFEVYADSDRSGKRTSPLIEQLQATEQLRAKAALARDSEAVARLDLELGRIGRKMTGHV